MIRIICVLFVAALVSAAPEKPHYNIKDAPALFEKYIKDYNKVYKDEADRTVHYEAFVRSLEKINKWNTEDSSATFDLNHLSDFTPEEQDQLKGLKNMSKPH